MMVVSSVEVPNRFHRRCGLLVTLSSCRRTASRQNVSQEFNHGLVMSERCLSDNQIFEVRMDKKTPSWSGSIGIGVTCCDPATMETPFPSSATELRRGTWIMSGNSILHDGRSINENYGTDLDKLGEGDRVGVVKTSTGDLIFFVNGVSQAVAAKDLPDKLFAVVDLYGKCAQVTLMDNSIQEARIISNELSNEATAAATSHNRINMLTTSSNSNSHNNITNSNIAAMSISSAADRGWQDSPSGFSNSYNSNKIRFHERKGSLVKFSNNHRTAERRRPYDEFNNGVVMTHRPLRDNELFEIRLDRLVDKWSGSIEVGITMHNPDTLDFPATMTNAKSGTMMMSGCGILTNGRGTRREYGQFNLDELNEGDRIGMIRKGNGNLHFYINGLDQGVAATKVPQQMWGVVDLYGMAVKVTIVDRDERDEQNLITRRNVVAQSRDSLAIPSPTNRLLFHPNCGSHAAVLNSGLTAHRPNAADDFNFGVVLTNRPLKVKEVFEVRLDKMVTKWAGSIEIGVTTHRPVDLEFPSTMTNVRSGTWMMTGTGVMHNGITIIDDYGQNLDKLKVGDRVGVMRKASGTVHFFVNGEDQGPAAANVPDCIYGVIDLYGQAAQATITDSQEGSYPMSPDNSEMTSTANFSHIDVALSAGDLKFHHLHGRNARISSTGLTASRPNALGEFNDAIVITSRPLKDDEAFEVVIERMVERWSGSIEAGVTLIRPEDLEFPNTMTDIDYDTWMLSGSSVMQDGQTVRNGYCCDLDTLPVGSRIGMTRWADGSLHYTINGEDQGIACEHVPPNVYGVIDLYGQCAQVSIVHNQAPTAMVPCDNNSVGSSQALMESSRISLQNVAEVPHRFVISELCKGVEVKNGGRTAVKASSCATGVVVGNFPLVSDSFFEVQIDEVDDQLMGGLRLGLVGGDVSEGVLAQSLDDLVNRKEDLIYIDGSTVKKNGNALQLSHAPPSYVMRVGDKFHLRHSADGELHLGINEEEFEAAVCDLPAKMWPVVELLGSVRSISVTSNSHHITTSFRKNKNNAVQDDSLNISVPQKLSETLTWEFHDNHGKNIVLSKNRRTATRTKSFDQGIVLSGRPLVCNEPFCVSIDCLDQDSWDSSLVIGILSTNPDKLSLPRTALGFNNVLFVCGDVVVRNQFRQALLADSLNSLKQGQCLGLCLDSHNDLHLLINGSDQGVIARDVRAPCHAFVDLYGQCRQVSIVTNSSGGPATLSNQVKLRNKEKTDDTGTEDLSFTVVTEECRYLRLCSRVASSMGLPRVFLDISSAVCFCSTCFRLRGESDRTKKGDPPRILATPQGWVKFSVGPSSAIPTNWHTAYHGTRLNLVRKILDYGKLCPEGDILVDPANAETESKDDDGDVPPLIFSPTLKYLLSVNLCPSSLLFRDSATSKHFRARFAFQVEVHPGSYKVGPPSVCSQATSTPDPIFKLEETEWLTKERGNTVISALMIQASYE